MGEKSKFGGLDSAQPIDAIITGRPINDDEFITAQESRFGRAFEPQKEGKADE